MRTEGGELVVPLDDLEQRVLGRLGEWKTRLETMYLCHYIRAAVADVNELSEDVFEPPYPESWGNVVLFPWEDEHLESWRELIVLKATIGALFGIDVAVFDGDELLFERYEAFVQSLSDAICVALDRFYDDGDPDDDGDGLPVPEIEAA